MGDPPQLLLTPTDEFRAELQRLDQEYCHLRTAMNVKPILMLQIYHANLNLFADFLEILIANYTNPRLDSVDPRKVELRRWNLKGIIADSHLYRQLTSGGKEMIVTLESLLDVVSALKGGTDDQVQENKTHLEVLGAEIRGCIKQTSTRLAQISDDLDHSVKLLNMSRDMRQSGNVKTLTLLATLFLPLSLSAGVLSMQSRFKDLGALLYDFFGVVALLTAILLLLIIIGSVFSSVKDIDRRLWPFRAYSDFARVSVLVAVIYTILVLSILLIISFVVGMFKDLALGAKYLGYGISVAFGWPVALTLVFKVVSLFAKLIRKACCHII